MNNHVVTNPTIDIIAYKLGDHCNGEMLARSVLDAHYNHAINNGGRVLFTVPTENVTKVGKNKQPDQLIMILGDFSDGFIAEVDDFGEFHSKTPSNAYQNPSQFDTIQESQTNYTWFELKNPKKLATLALEQFTNVNTGKPLIESLSGQSCRIYVQ
ncbi:hypothetical protein [Streptococcus suis]|uniref:hypothetical protein n=1 Tax=Streptococcus suis TaxID=1307 RepID=UPI000CF597FF|nr:hypothetical protein [Streptococcus suis]MBS8100322.1 hypothetical protein [Streptococcus suis]MCK3870562.1 hypothetical protein [Streptococcus suis]NQK23938.1 hypothetical protein [Streptococcus suis]NQL17087.1 hypothetical protein [Streptococcus suis]HEM4146833.1 hypothetical protein [Streptococcus suis]